MRVTSVTIGLPVTDLPRARRWYETVLEVEGPDVEPVEGVVEYRVGGIWLQLGESEERPGGSTVRIGVPDVRAERERLVGLGIGAGPVEVVEGVITYWDLQDPDGNRSSLYTLATDVADLS